MSEARIVSDPAILLGKPAIRGTRVSVELILDELAGGATVEDLLRDYPFLAREDIQAALAYALAVLRADLVVPAPAGM
ncbi:MAG: DUF433 domain-containing protein [Chloroflexi bacterium]|nr:DUF433 domain-containing protein [Chloroflexota bacterium]